MSECGKCGQEHPGCIGHISPGSPGEPPKAREGQPCRKPPMTGQQVCASHGGRSPQAKRAATERAMRAGAEKLMLTLGAPVEGVDPGEVITERIAARLGHVRWLHARVQALEPDALIWGLTKRKTAVSHETDAEPEDETGRRRFAGTDEGDTHEAKPNIWYAMYVESADKLERLCIEAIRVGLDERRVRIDERMADIWVRVIDGMLLELGHDPNDPATADIVARHLALVA